MPGRNVVATARGWRTTDGAGADAGVTSARAAIESLREGETAGTLVAAPTATSGGRTGGTARTDGGATCGVGGCAAITGGVLVGGSMGVKRTESPTVKGS